MSKTIYRTDLEFGENVVSVPESAEFVEFTKAGDGRESVYWVQDADSTENTVKRHLYLVGTGHSIPDGDISYIGSVKDGPFVWHLVEVR